MLTKSVSTLIKTLPMLFGADVGELIRCSAATCGPHLDVVEVRTPSSTLEVTILCLCSRPDEISDHFLTSKSRGIVEKIVQRATVGKNIPVDETKYILTGS